MNKKLSVLIAAVGFICLSIGNASAASFNLTLDKQSFSIGEDFTVNLRIDSQGVAVNAAQGTIQYPSDILEVRSIDKATSVFNFWLQDPIEAPDKKSISFTGGSTGGLSGTSLNVVKIVFRVKGVGTGSINVNNGAITASDGSGTNVLVGSKGVDIVSASGGGQSNTQVTAVAPVIPPIVPITRVAVPSQKLPVKPDVMVGLYPDPTGWNNASAPFLVQWSLPADITAVATSVNKDPAAEPSRSEGLFDNKTFPPLDTGIWYLHVQFRNNIGWGPVAHYRIAIDTIPPLPFSIALSSGASSTDPQPTVSFSTSDQPSGVEEYDLQIGDADPVPVTEESVKLPLQAPGRHVVRVIARDKAGNSTEAIADVDIIPIESPKIGFVSKSVYIGEGGLEVRGSGVPEYSVVVSIKDIVGEGTVSSASVSVDEDGNWFSKIDEPLKKGKYFVEVISRDDRGAISLPVRSDMVAVSAKPIVIFAGIGVTPGALFIIITILLLGGFAAGWFLNRQAGEQRKRKIVIAKRDIVNVFNLIKKDIATAMAVKDGKPHEIMHHLEKATKDMEKMEKYIVEGVEEIDKKK